MKSWDDLGSAFERLGGQRLPHWENYLGFYSSWLDGYFREPWGMLMPIDDHGFHRGDAVFEAVRLIEGAYFDLHGHLSRLKRSAAAVGMELPKSLTEIEAICVRLAGLCGAREGVLRLYVSRGPGGFSPNPREVVGHQIYAAITKAGPSATAMIEKGARAFLCQVEAKDPFWSQIKSCNYLQNVLMKMECLERGFDFAICLNEAGDLCEGATENLMLISADGEMLVPKFDYTLRGTTVLVVMRLAEKLVREGVLRGVRLAELKPADLFNAREAAFVGTTLAVLPVASVDNKPIGSGKPGQICLRLREMLLAEMAGNPELRTKF